MLYIFCTIEKIKIVLCCVVLCYVMLCCVMLCYVILYYALLCYVDLFQLKAFPEGNSNVAEMVETDREKGIRGKENNAG